ncbi:MAG: SUMF1/EgtB/PvdO family nonheme iron enzyme [Desulfovermiculus sp.]
MFRMILMLVVGILCPALVMAAQANDSSVQERNGQEVIAAESSQPSSALPGVMMLLLDEQEKYSLDIQFTGQGQGQVHVSPDLDHYEPGTEVTLTAEADLGYEFTGWSGAYSGTELSCQVTMDEAKSISANFEAASTEPLDNQALLGPLAGATIRAYRLDDLSTPIEGPFLANNSVTMNASGSFDLSLTGIPDDEWILVTSTGGWDIDVNDDGVIDVDPIRNYGTLHALAPADQWRQGSVKINALTDIAWRYSQAWAGQASVAELEKRLNEVARILLLQKIEGDGEIDVSDLLAFVPGNTSHRDCLSFAYANILDTGGFAAKVRNGADRQDIQEALDELFGAHLSFILPDNLESEVQVRLSGFGRGRVESTDDRLVVDSEADSSAQKTMALYPRDREDPVVLNAIPTEDTEILGWSGCDQVSEDQTQCQVGLSSNRQVQVDFGYKEAKVDPQFVDLSLATVLWSGDILEVTVDEQDTELLEQMEDMAQGWYVAGMSDDQGPFLLEVTAVLAQKDNTWELETIQASLEDIIEQGSGSLKRALTHGDLEEGTYEKRVRSESGEILPVRLVSSKDPNDQVFRLQVGDVPDPEGELERISGDLVFKDGDSEIRLHGEVDVNIDLNTGLSYGFIKGLEYFKFVPEVGITPSLDLSCTGKFSKEKKKRIHTFKFASIKFMAGPVPVWVKPRVEIYIGVDGSIKAEASIGASYTMTSRGGVLYSDGEWKPVKGFDRTWDFDEPTFEAGGSIKGFLSAEPSLLVYNLTGPGLAIEPYLEGRVTAGFDPDCKAALDWGLWLGIGAHLQWDGNDDIPVIGTALGKLDMQFQFFDLDRKVYGGVLNACGSEPPALALEGQDIDQSIIHGSGDNLQTTYTLSNEGNQDMPWSVDKPAYSPVSVDPSEGNLDPGESVQVEVTVNSPGALDPGEHTYRLDFNNDFKGPIGQSGLGSTDRYVRVSVVLEDFPAPTLTKADRYTETTAKLEWSYPEDSAHLLAGFHIWYTQDSSLETGWVQTANVDRTRRSITPQGLPEQTVYVAVEAYGSDPQVQTALSQAKTVKKFGDGPDPGDTYTDPVTGMEFVWVPGGCYDMGCGEWSDTCFSNELPVHEVCLDGFWMGRYEVTIDQYRTFLLDTGDGSGVDFNDSYCPINNDSTYSLTGNKFSSSGNQPMIEVSWYGAQVMADWLAQQTGKDFRLATEAEWEYSARSGGQSEKYSGGSDLDSLGWYARNSDSRTHVVGTKAPNGLGIYDMSGNVWEWCSDWYDPDYYEVSPTDNPQGPSSGSNRVYRGGSWGHGAGACSTASRRYGGPGSPNSLGGFRLVLSPGQQ